MWPTNVIVLFILYIVQLSECEILENGVKYSEKTLLEQFNSYIDQTVELINKKQTKPTALPFAFTNGTWGYLFLNVDYSVKLFNGSMTGISGLNRSGDASIDYNKTTGILTVSATLTSQPVQASYGVGVKVYGFGHQSEVISYVPSLNIRVNISVSSANLQASLESISVTSDQAPNVTFIGSDPVWNYFEPVITDLVNITDKALTKVRSSVQATIDVLNSPSFGYL